MPPTTSSTVPTRPSGGIRSPRPSKLPGGYIEVWMMPGETALTRTPREAYSIASDRVAAAPARHLRDDPLGGPEEPGQVDPDDQRVVGGGVFGERLGHEHPGVVD